MFRYAGITVALARVALLSFLWASGTAEAQAPESGAAPLSQASAPAQSEVTPETVPSIPTAPSAPAAPATVYSTFASLDGLIRTSVPPGWFTAFETNGDTEAVFVSRENIEEHDGKYITGLSINRIRAVSTAGNHDKPSVMARHMGSWYLDHKKVYDPTRVMDKDGVGAYILDHDDQPPKGPDLRVHVEIWYDDPADVLCIVVFEAPRAEWDAQWVHGKRLVNDVKWREGTPPSP